MDNKAFEMDGKTGQILRLTHYFFFPLGKYSVLHG